MKGKIVGEKYGYVGMYGEGDGMSFSVKYMGKDKHGRVKIDKDISFEKNFDYTFDYWVHLDDIGAKAKQLDYIIEPDNIFHKDLLKFLGEKEKIVIEDDEPGYENIQKGIVKRVEFSKNEDNSLLIRFTADNEFRVFSIQRAVMVKNILSDGRSKIDKAEERQRLQGQKPDYLKTRLAELFADMRNSFEKEYALKNPKKVKKKEDPAKKAEEKYIKTVEHQQRLKPQKQAILPITFTSKSDKGKEDEGR